MYPLYVDKHSKLKQKSGVSGYFKVDYLHYGLTSKYWIIIRDLRTITTAKNLKSLIERFYFSSIDSKEIHIIMLDTYKKDMSLGIQTYPIEFLTYGLQDSNILLDIMNKRFL